jgi:hypothetical protein
LSTTIVLSDGSISFLDLKQSIEFHCNSYWAEVFFYKISCLM